MTLLDQARPLLDDAAARWGFAPLDSWNAALCGFLFALLVCIVPVMLAWHRHARRNRMQSRQLRERLIGRFDTGGRGW